VRRSVLYRSGSLDRVTGVGWRTMVGLGIRTIVDLRVDREVGSASSGSSGVNVIRVPMWGDGEAGTMLQDQVFSAAAASSRQFVSDFGDAKAATYVAMVKTYARGFGLVIEELCRPQRLPAVIHCAAGKDRTGLSVAIILRVLGVAESLVVADYVRSRSGISPERLAKYEPRLEELGIPVADFAPVYAAHAPALVKALETMRTGWGSVEGYITGPGGVSRDNLTQLRARLLAR